MVSLEVADVFRRFGPSYLEVHGANMLPSHRRAMEDIMACRTPAMGGHVFRCCSCDETFYAFHGCRNRSCPACHTQQTRQWLDLRRAELLPCRYYHVCVTVPNELRTVFRANQRDCYALLMKAAARAVLELCADTRYLGAMPAVLSVLHTWTAAMNYHPHVHLLVSGGGITPDGHAWRESAPHFLIPVRALSRLVRGKFMAMLAKERPDLHDVIRAEAHKRDWVTWCKPWGKGEQAVLAYLARYVHRIAITNRRILAMDGATVTYQYKDRKAGRIRTCTVSGHEFMRRFLQHVLPKGFHKVRYCGLWHSSRRNLRQQLRLTLFLQQTPMAPAPQPSPKILILLDANPSGGHTSSNPPCPHCGSKQTIHIGSTQRGHTPPARASP